MVSPRDIAGEQKTKTNKQTKKYFLVLIVTVQFAVIVVSAVHSTGSTCSHCEFSVLIATVQFTVLVATVQFTVLAATVSFQC